MTNRISDSIIPAIPANLPTSNTDRIPATITDAGAAAVYAWDEFFGGQVRNHHTRLAYSRAVRGFLDWIEFRKCPLTRVTPGMVGAYLDQLDLATPSKKLTLAALRKFFDALVVRHAILLNPAHSVRTERYEVVEGKTPEVTPEQVRALLASIETTTRIGRRDKAIVATLVYTAARAGAVSKLRKSDFLNDGSHWALKFNEKGGKHREIPVRHDLELFLLDYLESSGIADDNALSLFRTANRRTGNLTIYPMSGTDIWRMVKRRLKTANLPSNLSPHSFRVATVTDLLTQGVPLGDVQYLAGHSDPRTTRLYDRRLKKVTRNLVERISI